jgi:hypothetical protein
MGVLIYSVLLFVGFGKFLCGKLAKTLSDFLYSAIFVHNEIMNCIFHSSHGSFGELLKSVTIHFHLFAFHYSHFN